MSETTDVLGRMRVASPCRASWEGMEGDERVRFCGQCGLHVYNISAMTRGEAESLVARTEGRLCARLYRRADGTVLTKDCPTGLRAVRARAARAAGAAFAAVLGLFAAASGQTPQKKSVCPAGDELRVERTLKGTSHATVSGVVTDPTCAAVPGAHVSLTSKETGRRFTARTSADGEFLIAAVPPGTYTLDVVSPGFNLLTRDDFRLGAGESARLRATLDIVELMGVIELPLEDKPPIESHDGITIFRSEAITRLPRP
jgi:Carboxypeptidase regulatory-like domain